MCGLKCYQTFFKMFILVTACVGAMSKKEKKGGEGKKVMTEEEMVLYLQQKAQAQEEMDRRKEQTVIQFLKVYSSKSQHTGLTLNEKYQ